MDDKHYIEAAKKMIINRFIEIKAQPNHMIMSADLFNVRAKCTNPKTANSFDAAINELKEEGIIYGSGLGIHLTQEGYDRIW
ncbi:MAG: hypothetical protein FWE74_09120 [Oscillospiraceae bacterium]|nr:hypothetical protein [Oscillospiraceae bacterium]